MIAGRYCDLCGGLPAWAEPLVVVSGLLVAVAVLTALARLDSWLAKRRRPK